MGMQVIICVETNKECKSDMIYIRNTIQQFYKVGQADVRFTYVYMGGKGNYSTKKIDKEIKDYVKQYKVSNPKGECVVVMCFDCDDYDTDCEDAKFLEDVKEFCRSKGYYFVWFCKDIEEVYLGKCVPQKQKKESAERFAKSNGIAGVDKSNLKLDDKYQKGKSNLCTVLDRLLIPVIINAEFRKQMDSAADWAKSVGMTEDDITDAKKTVRSRKKEV